MGKILLEVIDINLCRYLIGYVLKNQFYEGNIIFGKEGISELEMLEACKKAYTEEFINNNE
jgi:ABC-type multidrug transport system fused ATPase/permease subunit